MSWWGWWLASWRRKLSHPLLASHLSVLDVEQVILIKRKMNCLLLRFGVIITPIIRSNDGQSEQEVEHFYVGGGEDRWGPWFNVVAGDLITQRKMNGIRGKLRLANLSKMAIADVFIMLGTMPTVPKIFTDSDSRALWDSSGTWPACPGCPPGCWPLVPTCPTGLSTPYPSHLCPAMPRYEVKIWYRCLIYCTLHR